MHALGQVVHFLTVSRHSTETFVRALNALLPHDVRVLAAEEKPQAFHATLDAKSKRYRYVIDNGAIASAFQLRYSWHVHPPLDDAAMARAGRLLAGTARLPQLRDRLAQSYEQRPHHLRSDRRAAGSFVTIEVEADGFLYNMVRSIAGTLMLVGAGKRAEAWVAEVLAGREPGRWRGRRRPPRDCFW